MKRALVVGASGVVGLAATRRLVADDRFDDVLAVSRRAPLEIGRARHLALDITDTASVRRTVAGRGVTHVVYTALQEAPGLHPGWFDEAQVELNRTMFANVLDAAIDAGSLEHVTLLQGTKAYGVHVFPDVEIPCREVRPRRPHTNFYFAQEDYLYDRQRAGGYAFTILRPQIVFGDSLGSPMNLIPALGVYAAVMRARSEPLHFPGGPRHLSEAADADLVGDVIAWAAHAPNARNEVFNVANGDVFNWPDVWPAIADALGIEPGEPRPQALAAAAPGWAPEWAAIVEQHSLRAPADLDAFVGQSFIYADMLLGGRGDHRIPQIVSTIKLREAGFHGCIDTEAMFRKWFATMQRLRLLPPK